MVFRKKGRHFRKKRHFRGQGSTVAKLIGNKFHNSHYATHNIMGNYEDIGTNAAGEAIGGAIMLNYPGYVVPDNSSTPAVIASMSNQYTRIFNVYDEYRVIGLKVTFTCPYTQVPTGSAAPAIASTGNALYPFIHVGVDPDDAAPLVTVNEAHSLLKYKKANLFNGRPVSMHMRQYDLVSKTQWLNCAARNPTAIPVATATISGNIAKRGSIKYFIENAINTLNMQEVVCEWLVVFRGLNNVIAAE